MMNDRDLYREASEPMTLLGGESAGPPPEPGGWAADLPDELRGLAQAKGWKWAADALESYRNLEELMGADKAGRGLVMPRDENDREGYDRLYQALGRPGQPDGYELNRVLEGEIMDGRFMDVMSRTMHEAGLSKKQAASLARAYQDHYNEVIGGVDAEYHRQVEEMVQNTPPADLEAARRGVRLAGVDRRDLAKVEKALGPAMAMELFRNIGYRISEDRMNGGAEGVGLMGPAEAKSRIEELKADPVFRNNYLKGEPSAVARLTDLYRQASVK